MLGQRIKRARKALGLSLRGLAEKLELSHAAIKKYEDDDTVPSSAILLKLANILQVNVEYFFRANHFTLENVQYRLHSEHAKMPKSQLNEIKSLVLDQIERRMELEELFPKSPVPAFSVKNLAVISKDYDIEEVALEIRKLWELGNNPIPALTDRFEEKGIKVLEIDNKHYPKFDGLSAFVNGIPIIVTGKYWSGERQRFTLAHELGHLVFANKALKNINEELWCNHFAGAFLLPKKALIAVMGEKRHNIEVRELMLCKKEFGISVSGILHRLEDLEVISSNLYKELRREWKNKYLEGDYELYPRENSHQFEHLLFRALAEEYLSESKAAELMNVSLEKFRKLRMIKKINIPKI